MVKWHKLLLITATTMGLLAACEEEGSVDDAADDLVTENTEEETEEEVEEEPTTSLGKSSNPVPMGETAQIDYDDEDFETEDGVLEVTLSNMILGDDAYEMLLEENPNSEEAPEGYQWLIFDVEATH
ncbi:hypothetical protein [Alkalibacterium sp. 20]|uniref:hypothetical protein n=1 Tax=Alkalibacterium sp. 20 TaxID=1798803 RepID=UPI0009000CC7|nr:hypothetical protein [Alkalibacterium sp. 20]OJF91366.1 hypothetical protein AX762_11095 [Alkalibacterium sp. 20]